MAGVRHGHQLHVLHRGGAGQRHRGGGAAGRQATHRVVFEVPLVGGGARVLQHHSGQAPAWGPGVAQGLVASAVADAAQAAGCVIGVVIGHQHGAVAILGFCTGDLAQRVVCVVGCLAGAA